MRRKLVLIGTLAVSTVLLGGEVAAQCRGGGDMGGGGNRGGGNRGGGRGAYGGPDDVVRGGTTPRDAPPPVDPSNTAPTEPTAPTGPTTPAGAGPLSGPTTPLPGAPRGPTRGRGPTTGGIPTLGTDLTEWQHWWAFNRAPFLRLKTSLYGGATVTGSDDYVMGRGRDVGSRRVLTPSKLDQQAIAKQLKQVIQDSRTKRATKSAALLALAHVSRGSDVRDILKGFLYANDRRQAENAILGLGMCGDVAAVTDLLAMATCNEHGHALTHTLHVPYRMRAFACYALGLAGATTTRPDVKLEIFDSLQWIVNLKKPYRWDLKVAALHALRQLRSDHTYKGRVLQHRVLSLLRDFIERKGEPAQIRAHAITAIADVAGHSDNAALTKRLSALLVRGANVSPWLRQSAAQALGRIAQRGDSVANDRLRSYLVTGKDLQARFFAAIALGKIGGAKNRDLLLSRLVNERTPTLSKPWLALGLAILDRRAREDDPDLGIDRTVAEAILAQFRDTRNALYAGGFATALGLMRFVDAAPEIEQRLAKVRNQTEAAGHLAVALGLMRNTESRDKLRALLARADRQPHLLSEVAVALALLGDKELPGILLTKMRQADSRSGRRSIVQALGLIGDRHSIPGIQQILDDQRTRTTSRTLAVVALGLVGDTRALPWNTRFASDVNYQAPFETLSDESHHGILDLW